MAKKKTVRKKTAPKAIRSPDTAKKVRAELFVRAEAFDMIRQAAALYATHVKQYLEHPWFQNMLQNAINSGLREPDAQQVVGSRQILLETILACMNETQVFEIETPEELIEPPAIPEGVEVNLD